MALDHGLTGRARLLWLATLVLVACSGDSPAVTPDRPTGAPDSPTGAPAVALFVIRPDGTRPTGWVQPFHVPEYLDGLDDLGANIVATTLEVAVARLDGAAAHPDLVFAGYDGQIHAVRADGTARWAYRFISQAGVLTSGVVIADLTRDGSPEIVFAT